MNKEQLSILESNLGINLSEEQVNLFKKYMELFLEKNSHTNLISKNDAKLLFEKHIFDSLAIHKFMKYREIKASAALLDIGTGGGFPSIPLAILYEELNVFPLDSITKKINIIEELKTELELKNIFPMCDRAENLQLNRNAKKYDYVTTRAVAPIEAIIKYAMVNLKSGGHFIAYKSKKAMTELKEAEKTTKRLGAKVVEIIEYTLPLEELYERNLIIFEKK